MEVDYAQGSTLVDVDGKRYYDLIAGIGVSYLGHNHPSIVDAIKEQAERYLHTMVYGEFVLSPQVKYAQALTEALPNTLESVYFVNSGAEATEVSIKLAKRITGRSEIIAMGQAYHGSTIGALSLNSEEYYTQAFRPLMPGVRHIEFNNEQDLELITEATAAVIVEPVKAESGIDVPRDNYLAKLRERCSAMGALLIFDEIQTGFGRTGSLFAMDLYGAVPDILLLAKALGAGMPLGAVISSKQKMDHFAHHPVLGHITTFGGHPVSCAAGLAAFEELQGGSYIEDIPRRKRVIEDRLQHIPAIQQIRSIGLWYAIDLGSKDKVLEAVSRGMQEGILVDWFLFNAESIRLAPAINIPLEELENAIDILSRILQKI